MSVHWRDALWGGWFSYRLAVTPERPLTLRCVYWGRERGPRAFDILLDGKLLAPQNISDTGRSEFFYRDILLPESLIAGRTQVTVKFQAHPGNLAGGLYGLTLVRGEPAVAVGEETKIKLPSGCTLSLSGSWKAADRMWPDTALVFPGDLRDGGVTVICGGELTPRVIYQQPWGGRDGNTRGFVFSHDGTTCFAWLHNAMQLTAINMKDGAMKSLLKLPTHVWNDEGLQHVDPHPVVEAHLLFQEDTHLLLLLQEESNAEVAPTQQSPDRHGGHQLVSIPQDGVTQFDLTATPQWPGEALEWDLARARKEIYLLVFPGIGPFGNLVVRRLDGTPVDKLGQRVRIYVSEMALAPDERWLLVEHQAEKEDPQDAQAHPPVVRRGPLASVNEALTAARKSICLLNLVNDEAIEIAGDAYYGSWAPDSQSVTYLRDWELWRLNLSDLKEERIAWREPGRKGHPSYPEPPTWSPDGKRLVVCLGEDADYSTPSLLLDFPRHEYLIVPMLLRDAVWSPIPRPFLGR
jgi:hypothetical protein